MMQNADWSSIGRCKVPTNMWVPGFGSVPTAVP
jgi:hypothetical protein